MNDKDSKGHMNGRGAALQQSVAVAASVGDARKKAHAGSLEMGQNVVMASPGELTGGARIMALGGGLCFVNR